jgi:hypothetical protein
MGLHVALASKVALLRASPEFLVPWVKALNQSQAQENTKNW